MGKFLQRAKRKFTHASWFLTAVAIFAATITKLYIKTLRVEIILDSQALTIVRYPFIAAFWHGKQLLLFHLLLDVFKDRKISVITDISWSGNLLAKILDNLGIQTIRGSSRRNGITALRKLQRALRQEYIVGVALDGPRGPIYQAKPGTIFLARTLQIPILPIVAAANNDWQLSTWCRFCIPKPFSRCIIQIGTPMHVGIGDTDRYLHKLNTTMNTLQLNIDWKIKKNSLA